MRKQKKENRSSIGKRLSLKRKATEWKDYPVGPHGRMGHEGFMAAIGGWSGDLSKRATWLAPATGTARNRPIEDLIDWLNTKGETKQGQRLKGFIDDLKRVELLSDSLIGARFVSSSVQATARESNPLRKIKQIHARIQTACMRYCLYPSLTLDTGQKHWSLDFCTQAKSGETPVVYDGPYDFGRRVFEGDAAIVVIGIAERGEISRLRPCMQCGSWFFASANTSHNARKFCKEACRLKYFHKRNRAPCNGRQQHRAQRRTAVPEPRISGSIDPL